MLLPTSGLRHRPLALATSKIEIESTCFCSLEVWEPLAVQSSRHFETSVRKGPAFELDMGLALLRLHLHH